MNLLDDDALERSSVVANCRMNRERDLNGTNGYDRELGFKPIDFLKDRLESGHPPAWLDLCCGTGKALIQAATGLDGIEIVGVDLVGIFADRPATATGLRLVEASIRSWSPDRPFDLITCIHGLHYVGDKLGLIARAVSWLTPDGLFSASLDLDNLRLSDGRQEGRAFVTDLRRRGLDYDRRRRLVSRLGPKTIDLPYRYLGADDQAGPNHTGQPAVNSYYVRE